MLLASGDTLPSVAGAMKVSRNPFKGEEFSKSCLYTIYQIKILWNYMPSLMFYILYVHVSDYFFINRTSKSNWNVAFIFYSSFIIDIKLQVLQCLSSNGIQSSLETLDYILCIPRFTRSSVTFISMQVSKHRDLFVALWSFRNIAMHLAQWCIHRDSNCPLVPLHESTHGFHDQSLYTENSRNDFMIMSVCKCAGWFWIEWGALLHGCIRMYVCFALCMLHYFTARMHSNRHQSFDLHPWSCSDAIRMLVLYCTNC